MNILSLTGVSKTLNDTPLFEDVTLGIDEGEKVGFVGKNGSGKSTFLRLVAGELEPDTGTLSRNGMVRIATVHQRPEYSSDMTLLDFYEPVIAQGVEPHPDAFTGIDAYRSFCRELGLTDLSAPMGSLSGGMVRKATLARCIAAGANFLLLDEPTNHLDLDTIEWLENLLTASPQAFIMVTHDRYFLDAVCTSIMEIDSGRIYKYSGNYQEYLERKAARAAVLERAEERRITVLRAEMAWLSRGPRARTGKDKGRKARAETMMDAGLTEERSMGALTSAHRRLGKKVLELHDVEKLYDGRRVVGPLSHEFRRGERIGIIGPNGSGKSTLLNLIAGRTDADGGAVIRGENTVFAYFDQTSAGMNGKLTVLEAIRELAERVKVVDGTAEVSLSAEQFLERFLFPRSMFSTPIELLSGGELRRLSLVRVLAAAPNFLLLDEPTNDLDIDTIRLLEEYLSGFPGCLLLVSHDRALLDRLTESLFIFAGSGSVRRFVGNYQDFRQEAAEQAKLQAQAARKERERTAARESAAAPPASARQRKAGLSFRERQELEGLLDEIAELEEEQRELERQFQLAVQDPAAAERNSRRYPEVLESISKKTERWEELANRESEA